MGITAWKISCRYRTINYTNAFNDLCNSSSRCLEKYTWYSNIRCNLFMNNRHKPCIWENAYTYLVIKIKIKFLLKDYPVQILKGNPVYYQYDIRYRLRTNENINIPYYLHLHTFKRKNYFLFLMVPRLRHCQGLYWVSYMILISTAHFHFVQFSY